MCTASPSAAGELLHYPAPVIDVAVLRGTTADVAGNIGFEREAVLGDSLNQVLRLSRSRVLQPVLQLSSCECLSRFCMHEISCATIILHSLSRCNSGWLISLLERQQG